MNKQLQICINDGDAVVIDIIEDESITINVDYPPTMDWKGKQIKQNPTYKVNGLRWRGGEHFHLGWLKEILKLDDKITIRFLESSATPTPPIKEELYIAPELDCSFCHKKSSEVKHLVDGGVLARICDECVIVCQKVIDEKDS